MTDPTPQTTATRVEAVLPSEITEAQINSACLSYRHDFGLLDDHDKERLRFVAKEWLHAWRKEFDPLAPALKVSAPAPASGRVDAVIDQASRLMAAGWRGNPNMSGDDRDFMSPSMRRRHDDKVRQVVEFVLASLSPAATPEPDLADRHLAAVAVASSYGGDEGWEWLRRYQAGDADCIAMAEAFDGRSFATPVSEAGGEVKGWAAVYDGQIKSCHRSRETCIADAEHYQAIHPVYLGPAWRHQED